MKRPQKLGAAFLKTAHRFGRYGMAGAASGWLRSGGIPTFAGGRGESDCDPTGTHGDPEGGANRTGDRVCGTIYVLPGIGAKWVNK